MTTRRYGIWPPEGIGAGWICLAQVRRLLTAFEILKQIVLERRVAYCFQILVENVARFDPSAFEPVLYYFGIQKVTIYWFWW